jgi:hypothetical protein
VRNSWAGRFSSRSTNNTFTTIILIGIVKVKIIFGFFIAFWPIAFFGASGINESMPRGHTKVKSSEKPKTIQRTYRFDTNVFEAFEEDCARHLSNPKRVIEAAIIFWLDADPNVRGAIAQEHQRRIGAASDD